MIINKKYLCIFCGKRKSVSGAVYKSGHIGICPDCLPTLPFTPHPPVFPGVKNIDYIISPFFYEGKIRDTILRVKFNGDRAFFDALSYLLKDMLNDMAQLSEFDAVVPVPLSKKRFSERGYNQSALLAKPLSEHFGIEYRDDILTKIRETKRQSRIDLSERLTNVRGAFAASEEAHEKSIILVDDIFTTGTTLSECAAALKISGAATIVAVTLAKREAKENFFNRMY